MGSLSQQLQQQQQQQQSRKSSRSSGSGGSSSSMLSPTSSMQLAGGTEPAGTAAGANSGLGSSGAAAVAAVTVDPRQQQHSNVRQLLQQLFLQAPASFVALDCLPQLCRALLGPSAAHALLHSPYAGSSSSSSSGEKQQQQQQFAAAAEVAECLPAVVGTARRLASAVSPRWVSEALQTGLACRANSKQYPQSAATDV
jgi:hypothetical protein